MTVEERLLYHQIHPLKLLTDLGVTPCALLLLRQHRLAIGLAVSFLPPVVASAVILRYAELEPYERSRVGRYVRRHMTPAMQALRLAGAVVMMLGAWYRRPWLLPAGLCIILFGWLRGLLRDLLGGSSTRDAGVDRSAH